MSGNPSLFKEGFLPFIFPADFTDSHK